MKTKLFLVLLLLSFTPSFAQTVITSTSAPPQTCTNGTGASITSVGSTPVTVCAAAANNKRNWYRVTNSGSYPLYCTDDGSTPSATNWSFIVTANNWTVSSSLNVSPLAIICVAPSGTDTITAAAVQSGTP